MYQPGETLEPDCAPGSLNCGVLPLATAGANTNITSLAGLTTALTIGQGGTNITSYTAGDLLYASDASTLSKLSIGSEDKILKVSGGALIWGNDTDTDTHIGTTDITLTGGRLFNMNGNSLTFDGTADVVFSDSGDVAFGGAVSVTGGSAFSGNFVTPKGADFFTTGSQNDVNLGTGSLFRYTGVSGATFTGIAGGTDGRILRIMNATSDQTLVITNEDANSLEENRVLTANGLNLTVAPNAMVSLIYDFGASRWRVVALPVSTLHFTQGGNAFGSAMNLGTTDANALNLITGGAARFSLAADSATLTGTGATSITTDSTLSLSSAAASALAITSGTTGTLTLDSGSTGAINLGTGSDSKTITVGNTTGTTALSLNGGSGGITLTTGTGLTTVNSTAITLAGNSTVLDMTGTGTLGLNTTTNRAITTGSGLFTAGGDLTISGDDLFMATNTSGALLVADGLNFNPVTLSGDATLNGAGVLTLNYNAAQSASATDKGFLTSADWNTFNNKQNALGFTAENTANKSTDTALGTSDILYPTQNAVKTYIDNGEHSFGNGLALVGLDVRLGALTADWNQTGAFDITTAGDINLNGGDLKTTASTAALFNTSATTLNIGGAATAIALGAAGATVTGGGALTINSGAAAALTIDSGTTGTLNLGTGSNAKTINLGTGTAGDFINIGTNNTTADTIAIGSALDAFSLTSTGFNVTTGGALTGVSSLAFAGAGTVSSAASSALTFDSGTTLNLQSGTGNINMQAAGTGATGHVQVGTGSGSATPDLLVMDVKNTSGDPTGTSGAVYYNSNTGKFRCFENSAWIDCISASAASDVQHAASYDTSEAMTNIPTGGAQVTLGTVSVTPADASSDVYVTGWADAYSGNAADQPLQMVIETTSNCTGSTVGNAAVTYTLTSGASTVNVRGTIRVSGLALNPGVSAQPYSLCAAVTSGAGDSDIMNWGIEALVLP